MSDEDPAGRQSDPSDRNGASESDDAARATDPSDEEVVQVAAEAAEGVVFSRYRQSEVDDLDVTVTFEEGVLEVDVYLNAPAGDADSEPDPDAVVEEAVEAAADAVDDLLEA